MLSRELQEEFKRLFHTYEPKELREKLNIPYHEYVYYKNKFGFAKSTTYIRLPGEKVKFIKDHMDMSTYSLSNLLDISVHMVNKTKQQIKEGKI